MGESQNRRRAREWVRFFKTTMEIRWTCIEERQSWETRIAKLLDQAERRGFRRGVLIGRKSG
jgi:hypothetical protein